MGDREANGFHNSSSKLHLISALREKPKSRRNCFLIFCWKVNAGELAKRGHKLDFIVAETYGEEETSIRATADLWTKNVSAYIGPQETCVHEGRMAAAFNIPMISYVSQVRA